MVGWFDGYHSFRGAGRWDVGSFITLEHLRWVGGSWYINSIGRAVKGGLLRLFSFHIFFYVYVVDDGAILPYAEINILQVEFKRGMSMTFFLVLACHYSACGCERAYEYQHPRTVLYKAAVRPFSSKS